MQAQAEHGSVGHGDEARGVAAGAGDPEGAHRGAGREGLQLLDHDWSSTLVGVVGCCVDGFDDFAVVCEVEKILDIAVDYVCKFEGKSTIEQRSNYVSLLL